MARRLFILFYTILVLSLPLVHAQILSTNTPVPPLQWINLSDSLHGSPSPPPLKDAAIGYDETSRSMIIFGGESASGFVQSQTYLLDLDTFTWSRPSPPGNLQRTPPARSAAIAGCDFAASNRHGFVVIGGKGADGRGLSDVWEYDFNNQFWSEVVLSPGGPSPRWGASGGIDVRTPFIQDAVVPGPNHTFYLAGGFDGTHASPLSDIWRLNISGTLSSNLPGDSAGSWDHLSFSTLPPRVNQAGTVVAQQIITAGGCNTTEVVGNSCARQDSFVMDTQRRVDISPDACPAPRLSPVVVPNTNTFSSTFSSQVFLLLGTFNSSLWQDDGGLDKGEVAVLDINTGSWSRVLPSGDPGTSGNPTFPGPREGAAAISFSSALVGRSRNTSSDIIVFGGRDVNGQYLADVWLLRSYNAAISPLNPTWSGFGNGQLQTGANAEGRGVRNGFLTQCASIVDNPSSTNGSMVSPTSLPPAAPTPSTLPVYVSNTSILHKVLAPLSIALLQLAFVVFRLAPPSFSTRSISAYHVISVYVATVLAVIAYAIGITGLATAFTTISITSSITQRSSPDPDLKSDHGRAGIAFFICLYGVIPLLILFSAYSNRRQTASTDESERMRANSVDASEKLGPVRSAPQSTHNISPSASPRPRTHSWGPSSMWHTSHEGRMSSDSESVVSASPQRGFEVLNRPSRSHRSSGNRLAIPTAEGSARQLTSRSLQDVDWLQRRRSLNAVGELDYAITQASRAQVISTPATGDPLITPSHVPHDGKLPPWPRLSDTIIRLLIHTSLLGLSVISLVALWSRAPRAPFAVFLAWSVAFYAALFTLAWKGKPQNSILIILLSRLRTKPQDAVSLTPIPQSPLAEQRFPFPSQGPYIHHHPPYRATFSSGPDDVSYSHGGPRSVETDDNDDGEDEDARQRRIEDEMGRRDVSIVTIPKRKLWIANPS